MAAFGCDYCQPPDAARAWSARSELTTQCRLVDEPHYIVSVLACPRCEQRFIAGFTETIDWDGGEDPQHWTVMPVLAAEVAAWVRLGSQVPDTALLALPARRSLVVDHPSGADVTARWGHGISIPHHD
jgi:hypothetical protein